MKNPKDIFFLDLDRNGEWKVVTENQVKGCLSYGKADLRIAFIHEDLNVNSVNIMMETKIWLNVQSVEKKLHPRKPGKWPAGPTKKEKG